MPIGVGGTPFVAVLDTRSTGALGFTPGHTARLTFEGELAVIGRARGAGIPETEVRGGRLAGDVTIGGYTFPRPFVSVRARPPLFPQNPIVGTQVLQHFVVTLDQRNARLRLAREGPSTIELPQPQRRPPGGG
jgi:hypothetical protein